MSWKDCDDAMGPGLFVQLKEDGDKATFVFVADPRPREGMFKGKPRTQFTFPVMTEEGLAVWSVGSRLYRQIRDQRKVLYKGAVRVTRHGAKDDTATKYDMKVVAVHPVLAKAMKGLKPKDIDELFKSVDEMND